MAIRKHPTRKNLMVALLAIVLGGSLYIFFRPVPPVFFGWMSMAGFGDRLETIRQHSLALAPVLPGWVVYALPQGLWAFAYALIIAGIWKNQHTWISYLWLSTIPLMVIGFEVLQFAGVVRGTYCLQDLLCGMGGIVFGVVIMYGKQWRLMVNKNWIEYLKPAINR